MRSIWLSLLYTTLVCFLNLTLSGQMVRITPATAGGEEAVTLLFDASQGNKELMGANKVYVHHGVVTDGPSGTSWKYVKGNWGKDDGIGLMTKVPGEANLWQIALTPSVRSYFGVPGAEKIYRLACVFRSADGIKKGTMAQGTYGWGTVTSNSDIYINLNSQDYIDITTPSGNEQFYNPGQQITIKGEASSNVSEMQLLLDEGSGFVKKAEVFTGKTITYNYTVSGSADLKIRLTAKIGNSNYTAQRTHYVIVRKPTETATLPAGMKQGVNYHSGDPTRATLVFLAPQKQFVYAVGDFSDWRIQDKFQMKRDGSYYWITLENLVPGKEYVYQYWIDGALKIADPYTRKIADPWNDQWIETSVNPEIPVYNKQEFGLASTFKTAQQPFVWNSSENTWQRPDINHLVIYELHIRDFLASHSYKDLIDTLPYLKRLGINAIELMPVNEFEGNDSWGYNPSFFFATDKYYGTEADLKRFIEAAHQQGMAVIMDIVLNHAFGQCPMVQMYFDLSTGKPAANNPWFNREYVGPYQWGYDFNHESTFTKNFIDDVNRYWLEEFHFDGFRFDFTKGFTNYAPGGNIDGFDQSRINILKRMVDKIRTYDPKAYIILEHWASQAEEKVLSDYGMKMWGNRSYDFVPATVGNPSTGSFAGLDATSHVLFFNSHDERRIAEHCLTEGRSSGSYNIRNREIMYERVKMAAAFLFLQPGPKMLWQFDELAYDIDINFNGRTGRKPLVWGPGSLKYADDPLRKYVYDTYAAILDLRKKVGPQVLASAAKNHANTGETRRLVYNTSGTDIVVVGNFGLATRSVSPSFTSTGKWYDYFSGDSLQVTSTTLPVSLKPGEWHIYTNTRMSAGYPQVVEVFENPVTVTPAVFTPDDQITIRFDAKKASRKQTAGLVGASKVYMHSGTIVAGNSQGQWSNTVGTLSDDGIGQMIKVGEDIWEIKIRPRDYYSIAQGVETDQLAMYFRDASNTNFGYGFRNSVIFVPVASSEPIVTITPASFTATSEITVTFHAHRGNKELINAEKVYMHSGVGTVNTQNPQTSAWNKVVGNWGQDDGVGRMTKVPGTTRWEIKLVPRNYYGLTDSEYPFWIAAVFRDATGSLKGTGNPGPMTNGFISSNLDFFIRNQMTISSEEVNAVHWTVYPNPTDGPLQVEGISGESSWTIFSTSGLKVAEYMLLPGQSPDLSGLSSGMYFYRIKADGQIQKGKVVVY